MYYLFIIGGIIPGAIFWKVSGYMVGKAGKLLWL